MKILIAGDYCENDRVRKLVEAGDYEAVFGEVKPIVEAADYSIVNFEMPVGTSVGRPIKKCGPPLRGGQRAIESVVYAGFNCCTMANNHTLDQGEQCGLETKAQIEAAGMDTVGFGKDENDAARILYKTIGEETLALINCCEHEFSIATPTSAGTNGLNPIHQFRAIREAREKADYVVVIVHGGTEFQRHPSLRMQDTYRFFIEAGADAVVNHHQHIFNGMERYLGKPIYYGLGNFSFDLANCTHRWKDGFLLEMNLTKNGCTERLYPYIQGDEKPGVRLMNEEEHKQFEIDMAAYSEIVSDPQKLAVEEETIMRREMANEILMIEPYRTRVGRKLRYLGLLPSVWKGVKRLDLQNRIDCESHRDRLLYALKHEQ